MNNVISPLDLPPLPSLSLDLSRQYQLMSQEEKRLFRVLYRAVFNHLCPIGSLVASSGALSYYFVLWPLIDQFKLLPVDLSVLSRCWVWSGGGRSAFITTKKFTTHELHRIQRFVKLGYLSRSYFNPLHPHSHRSRHPVWLSFTPSGVQLYKQFNVAFQRGVLAHHLNDLTGTKKKASPIRARP